MRRAALSERAPDVQAAAARLLQHLQREQQRAQQQQHPQQQQQQHPQHGVPCARLLAAAQDAHDVPRLFLATLFLANAGNVEVVQGPPLTLNSFSVRVLSTDERLYRALADADENFLR
ncbi:unnamed protein product [Parnassius mnemosyne]|uniref:Uncharacterized protein n=1 Tax=Parnassius mnemosyne TaxID=213953 RepID=A0AAV1KQQ9_9NEOP